MKAYRDHRFLALAALMGVLTLAGGFGCEEPGACDGSYLVFVTYVNSGTQPVHLYWPAGETPAVGRLEAGNARSAEHFPSFFLPEESVEVCQAKADFASEHPQTLTFNAVQNGATVGTASVEVTWAEASAPQSIRITVQWNGTTLSAAKTGS